MSQKLKLMIHPKMNAAYNCSMMRSSNTYSPLTTLRINNAALNEKKIYQYQMISNLIVHKCQLNF